MSDRVQRRRSEGGFAGCDSASPGYRLGRRDARTPRSAAEASHSANHWRDAELAHSGSCRSNQAIGRLGTSANSLKRTLILRTCPFTPPKNGMTDKGGESRP